MIDLLLELLTVAIRDSDFIRTLRSVSRDGGVQLALAGEAVRPLRELEIRELVANGNTANGWHRVRVVEGFRPNRVRQSDFRGDVILGRFEGTTRGPGGVEPPAGVVRSTISNCVIGHDAIIRNVDLLSGYVVGERASVSDCGRVICDGPTTFGNGIAIPIGPQCGGRWLRAFAEMTLALADRLTSPTADGLEERFAEFIAEYLEQARSVRGVIGPGSVVSHVPVIRNVYIGASAELDAATRIENATLLSTPEEPVHVRDGACIADSVLQWGVLVCGPAVVERSILMEQSAVDRFGKATESVIGPNSAVGGAEVTASLVGPFVNCHHQGLLIAARWPGGRGNLGYGAGVGCNHTSRAPDQEAVLGEGLFIGLGAKIQYPADLHRSPYTVIASGVSFPPQSLAFPFSLVRTAQEPIPGAPAGANVLVPACVLTENLYAVQRSILKFRARDRAARNQLAHDIFRPDIMALVADARRRLERASGREVYTEKEIPGLGRSVLLERHRVAAVRGYTEHLDRFHLLRLLDRATGGLVRGGEAALLSLNAEHEWSGLTRLSGLLEAYGVA